MLGRYKLEHVIAVGGGATVYRALDCVTGELVAVKHPHDALARSHRGVARFLREARMQLEVDHPSIPQAITAGVDEQGSPWLVMQLVSGQDYESIVAERGPLPLTTALRVVAAVARAIAHAHLRGVVHRDIKPANIIQATGIAPPAGVFLVDFGIALGSRDTRLTAEGTFVGTPEYASPQQFMGEPVTAASDVYSLGATLFHLLTGAPPFSGTPAQLAVAHARERPSRVGALRPDAPPSVELLVAAMLAKDPEDRPFDLQVLADTHDAIASAIDGGLDAATKRAPDLTLETARPASEAQERLRLHAHRVQALMRAAASAEVSLFEELVTIDARALARTSIAGHIARAEAIGDAVTVAALIEQRDALGDEAEEAERRLALERALATLREHAERDQVQHLRRLRELESEVIDDQ